MNYVEICSYFDMEMELLRDEYMRCVFYVWFSF